MTNEQLAELFVRVADTLVEDFDLVEFLEMVIEQTANLISSPAAGLVLADEKNRLQLIAATSRQSRQLELFALQKVEGPSQDCFRTGTPVVSVDLETAHTRWPRFAPAALAAGFRSVHAFPMRLRDSVIGALNLFSEGVGELTEEHTHVVQALADIATIALLQERAIQRHEAVTGQLQTALNSRIIIEQAKGALAQIHRCTADEAFVLLRDWCRHNRLRLTEVAYGLTTDPSLYAELTRRDRDNR